VHRIDQCGRTAGAAERVADVGDLGERRGLAAQGRGDHDPHQAERLGGGDRLAREARVAVDLFGMQGGDAGDARGALGQFVGGRPRHLAERRVLLRLEIGRDGLAPQHAMHGHDRRSLARILGQRGRDELDASRTPAVLMEQSACHAAPQYSLGE
jgi:hypothetical protein